MYNTHRSYSGKAGCLMLAAGFVFVIGAGSHFSRDEYTVRVVGTERIASSDDEGHVSSKYVVHAEEIKTREPRSFENTDSLTECLFSKCKVNSSDLQAELKAAEKDGTPVTVKTYGWRVPFFSWYENIIAVKK